MGCSESKNAEPQPGEQAVEQKQANQEMDRAECPKNSTSPGAATPPGMTTPPGMATPPEEPEVKILSEEVVKEIRDLYQEYDIDATGKLPLGLFSSVSVQMGPHEAECLMKLEQMDYDSDGFITMEVWMMNRSYTSRP